MAETQKPAMELSLRIDVDHCSACGGQHRGRSAKLSNGRLEFDCIATGKPVVIEILSAAAG